VAAGIADYFDTDPVIVRLLWVLATAMGGAGVLGYLVLWIVIPPYSRLHGEAPAAREPTTGRARSPGPGAPLRPDLMLGGILVLLGAMLLMGSFDLGPGWDIFARLWPVVLLVPGVLLAVLVACGQVERRPPIAPLPAIDMSDQIIETNQRMIDTINEPVERENARNE